MENCSFRININGFEKAFNSEDELNAFIRDNKRTMQASLLSEKVLFSNDRSKQQQVFQELGALSTEVEFKPEYHEYFVGKDGEGKPIKFTPVTELITQGNKKGTPGYLGYNMVQPFDLGNWEKRTMQSLTTQLDENRNRKYTDEQAQAMVDKLKASWQTQRLLGTSWHNVAEAFFQGKIQTEKDVVEQFPDLSNLSNYVLTKYVKSLTDFRDTLYRKYPNALFLTEARLFDRDSKVAGTSDLLVIDHDGNVHIYDYKTSAKSELEWNSNKNESNRYQLAFYRQMLRRAGYNVGSTHILPVELKEIDYANNAVQDFDMGRISTKYFKETEALMQNVKTIMPHTSTTETQQITDNTATHQFMKETFNYEQKKIVRGSKSVDDEYDRMLRTQRFGDASQYYYWPLGGNSTGHKWPKTLGEAAIKNKIADILKDVDEANTKLPQHIKDFTTDAKQVIADGGTLGDVNWAGWSKDPNSNIKIRNLLHKYVKDSAWEVVDSDALADLNMISFENTQTNEIDFLSLSSDNLNQKPEFVVPDATTILGNFMNDNKAGQLGITQTATNGDVELLKMYSFIKANKPLYVDRKIGSMYALNIIDNDKIPAVKTQTLETLEKWHKLLSAAVPQFAIPDSTWEPQQIDKARSAVDYISGLLEDKSWKSQVTGIDRLKGYVKQYNDLSYDAVDEKIDALHNLSITLQKAIGYDFKAISQSSENNDIGIAIKLASEAILQLKKIPMTIEEDLKQWGYILNENANTTSPKSFKNLAQANLVSITTDAMNNVRNSFLKYVNEDGGLRDIHDKLYSQMSSVVHVKALGYNLDIFDKLLEHDADKPTMRFKDPDDLKNRLSQPQKDYIKAFLNTVNVVRLTKMIKNGKSDQDIADFLASPDARNIPLLKASALTAFKGKNFKQFTDDFFRELMNPGNIFSDDTQSLKRITNQSKMFNGFDLYDQNIAKRAERIDNAPEGEFETDLELVLATYMMAHHKEIEVNKKLPLVNAIQTSVMLNEIFNFNPTPNLVKLQKDYVATTLFGKTMLAGESEKVAKLTKGIQEATSAAMMWFNPLTGATEMISGLFGNVVRLMANKYNEHTFGIKEYLKAHAIVAGTLNENKSSIKHVGFCDAINEIYGLSEMDVQRAAHEVQTGSAGLAHFRSKYAYWFNTFPGYFNRLVLFTAQAIKDGVIDVDTIGHLTKNSAYQMIDSRLVYNEKLDKRFSLYTNNKQMPDSRQTKDYKEQKALYLAVTQDLINEADGMKSDGTMARAYNNKQRNSLKEFADEVHGSYDKENKTNFQKMAFGRIFMQFKGWISAKKNRWFTETNINETRGSYETQYDADGNPVSVWKGKVTEGITQSILAMYHEIQANKFNIAKSWDNMNATQRENFMFLLGDTLVFGLLALIVEMFTGPGMKKDNPLGYEGLHALSNSSKDFFIGSTIGSVSGSKNPLALASWSTKVLNDSWGVMTGSKTPSNLLDNVAIYRNINRLNPVGN